MSKNEEGTVSKIASKIVEHRVTTDDDKYEFIRRRDDGKESVEIRRRCERWIRSTAHPELIRALGALLVELDAAREVLWAARAAIALAHEGVAPIAPIRRAVERRDRVLGVDRTPPSEWTGKPSEQMWDEPHRVRVQYGPRTSCEFVHPLMRSLHICLRHDQEVNAREIEVGPGTNAVASAMMDLDAARLVLAAAWRALDLAHEGLAPIGGIRDAVSAHDELVGNQPPPSAWWTADGWPEDPIESEAGGSTEASVGDPPDGGRQLGDRPDRLECLERPDPPAPPSHLVQLRPELRDGVPLDPLDPLADPLRFLRMPVLALAGQHATREFFLTLLREIVAVEWTDQIAEHLDQAYAQICAREVAAARPSALRELAGHLDSVLAAARHPQFIGPHRRYYHRWRMICDLARVAASSRPTVDLPWAIPSSPSSVGESSVGESSVGESSVCESSDDDGLEREIQMMEREGMVGERWARGLAWLRELRARRASAADVDRIDLDRDLP